MTAFTVGPLTNGRTIKWEYIVSLGSPALGKAQQGIIRAWYADSIPGLDVTDGFGTSVGDAIIDLLRASRDLKS